MGTISEEWKDILDYLLTVDDPQSEAHYFSRLSYYTAEPSETLATLRHNAYHFADNDVSEWDIPEEDYPTARKFIRVESKIQFRLFDAEKRGYNEQVSVLVMSVIALGIAVSAIVGAIDFEGAVWGLAFLSFLFVVFGVPMYVASRRKAYKASCAIQRLNEGLDEDYIPGHWGFWKW